VLAPIPRAKERRATTTKTGDFRNVRKAKRRSDAIFRMIEIPYLADKVTTGSIGLRIP
jgi:hypothetical protein